MLTDVDVQKVSRARKAMLLGPAFVAAIAYVDPGNVAANITAGAKYGYLLVWVLVVANLMAVMIQYQSAKLGVVTGRSLPQMLGERLPRRVRLAFWGQAEIVAAATDVAEIIGGALALNLLFGVPLVWGGLIVGVMSTALLVLADGRRQYRFELVIIGLLAIIVIGFLAGLVVAPPDAGSVLGGLVPRLQGTETVLLAASMLGATVMPHAIYLHSALVIDRHGKPAGAQRARRLLRVTRVDVVIALVVAGAVNIALLVLAASALYGREGTDSIEGAHAAVRDALGPVVAALFAVGLLASGLASTSVGSYAGGTIMAGLLHRRIPVLVRRMVTMVPAIGVLALGVSPTQALIISQVVLSFGIPFALLPLRRYTGDRAIMGEFADGAPLRWASAAAAALIVALNVALIYLTLSGNG
ncbi:Mn2+/Fe2+ transporter, NRAMP family OS=Tsukamurella paurometabola (strain ATCC 8368 / DSM /CCUG 35730 / CIP 100753 / JCM 10117 / KCTC 9821 / NBRC 16120/ NCIMB 702349 / NCTC 13040) OX=521096 GN=Tpau_0858 PE=4 SV=1 [Tsukamurella paurometabola]|uniref:Mn2+/Fe2+ transporter, NRAMP family n=1 Tax=Tsukamurella paurometabola (strain ATCC 8368 / DSM 20162 / CCUG 35730 / CIP 100753 / JCM 10117 / KCTC 9821 / NBRC 16120 / NCIMB 702349 / NCTC 13040) TaxID=521096 RepID=D5UUC2_TSUPD|nr:Nramp family divalent metal transporter [Tsukamurella paurometabola]ADG77493.1 Mn2+/Fe2+ transporter, NRAMP family [Tsukamurella paurometabola DSM 20162]SUP27393.1 Manganese transport protein MntH [Tsukamurella paurometabola]